MTEQETKQAALAVKDAVAEGGYDLNHLGKALAASGFFPDLKKVSQGIVKVLAGREYGLGPMRSVMGIHFFDGKIEPDVSVISSLIRRHPHYDYRVVEITSDRCELEFYMDGEAIGTSVFTQEDAAQANIENKNTYQKWPRNMLFARAMHNGQKWYCPDAIDFFYDADVPIDLNESDTQLQDAAMSKEEKEMQSTLEAEQEIWEGDFKDLDDDERAEAVKAKADEGQSTLFPDEPPEGPPPPAPDPDAGDDVRLENQWEEGILEKAEDFSLVDHRAYAVNILNRSPFNTVPFGELDMIDGITWLVAWNRLKEQNDQDTETRARSLRNMWREEGNQFIASCEVNAKRLLGIPEE